MVDRLPLGPYRVIRTAEGVDVPWYMIPSTTRALVYRAADPERAGGGGRRRGLP